MAKDRQRSPGLQSLHDRYIGNDPDRIASFERALERATIAQKIYKLRTDAKLTQRQLAELAGTRASVISRLESADYEGHSLTMLGRIAQAVGKRVEVNFVSAD
jgi:DNA-binding XRE family transcriptional regulator